MIPFLTVDLNAFTGWLADANATFQHQEGIAFDDAGNRQVCLNRFVTFLIGRLKEQGTINPVETDDATEI